MTAKLVRWMVLAAAGGLLLGCDVSARDVRLPQWAKSRSEPLAIDPVKASLDARTALLQAADAPDPATRIYALEAMAGTIGKDCGAVFREALRDPNPAVRYAAAMAVGDAKCVAALGDLGKMAEVGVGDSDKRVYAAVMYALYRLGDVRHVGDMAKLLFDKEGEVRSSAAQGMGKMGEPSAIGPLKAVLANEYDEGVKLALVEALAVLGDTASADLLEAYTKGYFLDLRLAAIPALARSGAGRTARVLTELIQDRHPARVRLSAAGELARLGHVDDRGCELAMQSLREPQKVLAESSKLSKRNVDTDAASLKRLAAIALGWMNRDEAVNLLHPLLRDDDGGLRVAAAMSILRLLAPYRAAEAAAAMPAPAAATRPATAPTTAPVVELPATAEPAAAPRLHTAGGKD